MYYLNICISTTRHVKPLKQVWVKKCVSAALLKDYRRKKMMSVFAEIAATKVF